MRFTKTEKVPTIRCKLDKEFDEFMRLETKVVVCHFEEGRYKSVNVAYSTLTKAVKHWGYPIRVCTRKGEIYLIRTDM